MVLAAGGVALGLALGFLVAQLHRRLDDFGFETAITLLTPYAAYIPAEHLGLSGVLATVAAGGYLGWHNPQLFSALTRFRGRGVWSVLLMLFNGLVFILIGLELSAIRHFVSTMPWRELLAQAAAVSGVTIGVRLVWVPVAAYLPRLLSPRLRKREPRPRWEAIFLIAWTGMRGIVSLALALAVPLTLPNGAPFPEREVVIVLSFAVILVTLLVPGLTLPWLIARLHLEDDGIDLREERDALIRASEAALARLRQIDDTVIVHPLLMERVRAPYEERLTRLTTEQHEDPECRLTEGEAQAFRRMRGQALEAERQAVVAMRNEGKLGEEVLVRVQEESDLEALQPDR